MAPTQRYLTTWQPKGRLYLSILTACYIICKAFAMIYKRF